MAYHNILEQKSKKNKLQEVLIILKFEGYLNITDYLKNNFFF